MSRTSNLQIESSSDLHKKVCSEIGKAPLVARQQKSRCLPGLFVRGVGDGFRTRRGSLPKPVMARDFWLKSFASNHLGVFSRTNTSSAVLQLRPEEWRHPGDAG